MENIIEKVKKDIKKDNNSFYCNGSNKIDDNCFKLFYINKEKKAEYVNLPSDIPLKIDSLINSCKPAVFGKGDKTLEDKNYRSAYQLTPNLFSLDNKFDIFKLGII